MVDIQRIKERCDAANEHLTAHRAGNWEAHYARDMAYALDEIERLAAENEQLKELKSLSLEQYLGRLDMSIEGPTAKAFMAMLVGMFESAGATNFLTVTADYKDHHYGITIQKNDGGLTPEEQIGKLESENAMLRHQQAPEHRSELESVMLAEEARFVGRNIAKTADDVEIVKAAKDIEQTSRKNMDQALSQQPRRCS